MLCAEVESRTQGSRPRTRKNPRPTPRTVLPRTDPCEAQNRNARGQGHTWQVSSKKKVFKIFFQAISERGKQKRSIFREVSGVFLHNFKNEQIPTSVGTNANAHHTI